jgi:hypothetical protein
LKRFAPEEELVLGDGGGCQRFILILEPRDKDRYRLDFDILDS